jgi:hypothetical protein
MTDRVLVKVAIEGTNRDLIDVIMIIAPIPVNVNDLKKAILAEVCRVLHPARLLSIEA